MQKSDPFVEWLRQYPRTEIAEKVGVTTQCVYQWLAEQTRPQPAIAAMLVKLSRGKLDFNAIYRPLLRG